MKVFAVPFTNRVSVVRRQGKVLVVCPTVISRDEWLETMSIRLYPDELDAIRAGFGVADLDDLRASLPDDVCPCWWPVSLRPPDVTKWCPLHSS